MIEKREITEMDEIVLAEVRTRAKQADIGALIGDTLPQLFGSLAARGIQPTGMPMTVYHEWAGDECDVSIAVPVVTEFESQGDVTCSTLAAGRIVQAIHVGPYEGLAETYDKLQVWLKEQGLEMGMPCWEVYLTDPETVPDPAEWRTRIAIPVSGA